jgi:quinol monooxygenase YgiN
MSTSSSAGSSVAIIVQATIDPSRMDDFLPMISHNAQQSRQEPDCLQFDVVQSASNPNEFFFYEVYRNMAAIDHHKQQTHYQAWADFKANGGVVSSTTFKCNGVDVTLK